LQRLSVGHGPLEVGILRFEVGDDVGVAAIVQPIPIVDPTVAMGDELVLTPRSKRR
jgi:hypothetical protein